MDEAISLQDIALHQKSSFFSRKYLFSVLKHEIRFFDKLRGLNMGSPGWFGRNMALARIVTLPDEAKNLTLGRF